MRKRLDTGIKPSEITPESAFLNRRAFLTAAVAAGLVPSIMSCEAATIPANGEFADVKKWPGSATEKANTFEEITTYNNYYEFGTGKERSRRNAGNAEDQRRGRCRSTGRRQARGLSRSRTCLSRTRSRSASIGCRCVEAWSMVIPWVGFPLADLIKTLRADVASEVRAVHHVSNDRTRCPALGLPCSSGRTAKASRSTKRCIRSRSWSSGLYGKVLPNQNGAPLRLVLPWKYGFKSVQVDRPHPLHRHAAADELEHGGAERIRLLLERESGSRSPALEPGHGTAARRRSLAARIPTQMFNGYGDQVASLYTGLDLRKNY